MILPRKFWAWVLLLGLSACLAPVSSGQALPVKPSQTPLPPAAPTATLSPDELIHLSQDAASRGDWGVAVSLLDLAVAQDGANAQAFTLRGNAYQELGDLTQAISNYDQALSLDSSLAAAYNSRGLAYAELGDAAKALADFAKAIELAPTFGLAYRNRADLHITAGNLTAASLDLQIYLSLVPNAPDRPQIEAQITELQSQAVENAGENGLLFSDDFSDPNSGWISNQSADSQGIYDSQGYRLMESQVNAGVWALPGRLFTDVRIEVKAGKQGGDDQSNWFGLICRLQATTASPNFYVLIITSDGYFGIGRRNGDNLTLIGQEKMLYSSHIVQGDSTNTIAGICSGQRLALFVNGEELVEVTDAELSSGQAGLIVGTFNIPGANANILFDDFAVYSEPVQ